MRRLRREEGGWALVTAVLMMTFMLGSSLALADYMDGLTAQSGITRVRETSFNAAETALSSQITALTAQGWPEAAPGWPACTSASTDVRCPSAAAMRGLHETADTQSGFAWTTQVRDDGVATSGPCETAYYSEAAFATAPAHDANRNGCLWVRAQGIARGRTRTLVALVRAQKGSPSLPPNYAVYAGRVDFDSNAIKEFVQGDGGKVAARCTPVAGETTPCAGFLFGTSNARTLADLQASFSGSVGSRDAAWGVNEPTMSAADLARWRSRAQAAGTYHTSCPASLTGAVVWIEGPVSCGYTGSSVYNTAAAPGLLIVNGGTLQLGGTVAFHGVIYFPNPAGASTKVFDEQGTPVIYGSVIADGPALVNVGTSGQGNVQYTPSAFESTRLPDTAGIVQNTWRELPPNVVTP